METTTLHSHESFPKRIRSASARIFSLNHDSIINNKRSSCHMASSASPPPVILKPTKWFPRMRCRSSSSASSTFSLVFSSSSHTASNTNTITTESSSNHFSENHHFENHISLETVSSELEDLYRIAKEEIAYANESQESIYYEGDKVTAQTAFEACMSKYETVMQLFGDTANSVKFRFRWESDLYQLELVLKSLPTISCSIYD